MSQKIGVFGPSRGARNFIWSPFAVRDAGRSSTTTCTRRSLTSLMIDFLWFGRPISNAFHAARYPTPKGCQLHATKLCDVSVVQIWSNMTTLCKSLQIRICWWLCGSAALVTHEGGIKLGCWSVSVLSERFRTRRAKGYHKHPHTWTMEIDMVNGAKNWGKWRGITSSRRTGPAHSITKLLDPKYWEGMRSRAIVGTIWKLLSWDSGD